MVRKIERYEATVSVGTKEFTVGATTAFNLRNSLYTLRKSVDEAIKEVEELPLSTPKKLMRRD